MTSQEAIQFSHADPISDEPLVDKGTRMKLTPEQHRTIETIKATMDCQANFVCCKSGFDPRCSAEVYIRPDFVVCKEGGCAQSFLFGADLVICTCPLRIYAAVHLGREHVPSSRKCAAPRR